MGIQIVSLFHETETCTQCHETEDTSVGLYLRLDESGICEECREAPIDAEIDAKTEPMMMKSVDTYYSEIFDALCNSELAQSHDFNNGDVDHLIIDEILARIPATDTEKWITENPDSVEARTLLWLT